MQINSSETYIDQSFTNIELQMSILTKCEFESCKFDRCNFTEVEFLDCKFTSCEFNNCNFSMARLTNTKISDTSFHSCKLTGLDFNSLSGLFRTFNFFKCDLAYAVFNDYELRGIKFVSCSLREAMYVNCDLTNADFANSDLTGTRFERCNLCGANFVGAHNYFINSENNILRNARFAMPDAENLLQNLKIKLEPLPLEHPSEESE